MMNEMKKSIVEMASSSTDLADAVRKRGQVVLNIDDLTRRAAAQLDQQLARALAPRLDAIAARLDAHERRVNGLGTDKVGAVAASLEALDQQLDRVGHKVEKARKLVDWRGLGLVAAALLPVAIIALACAIVLWIGGDVLGVGPLAHWAWASFARAQTWWVKALIGAGAIGGVIALSWLIYTIGHWIYEKYQGW